jgi:hypothetical protein
MFRAAISFDYTGAENVQRCPATISPFGALLGILPRDTPAKQSEKANPGRLRL